ncbi:uncharacterized protein LOC144151797 isoform X2 [Haemaphysalis longicornis]
MGWVLGFALTVATVKALTFEEAIGTYCYVSDSKFEEFVRCILATFDKRMSEKVSEIMNMFPGLTFSETMKIMCTASMDSSAAMFDDFVTVHADQKK